MVHSSHARQGFLGLVSLLQCLGQWGGEMLRTTWPKLTGSNGSQSPPAQRLQLTPWDRERGRGRAGERKWTTLLTLGDLVNVTNKTTQIYRGTHVQAFTHQHTQIQAGHTYTLFYLHNWKHTQMYNGTFIHVCTQVYTYLFMHAHTCTCPASLPVSQLNSTQGCGPISADKQSQVAVCKRHRGRERAQI